MKNLVLVLIALFTAASVYAQRGPGPGPGPGPGDRDRKEREDRSRDRRDRWDRNRASYKRLIDAYQRRNPLRLGESVLGYTMIDDGMTPDFDNVELDRNAPKVDEVRLVALGDSAFVNSLSIDFCDKSGRGRHRRGDAVQSFPVNKQLGMEESTSWLDLQGRDRCVDSFSVMGRGTPNRIDGFVVLIGRNKPGIGPGPGPRPGARIEIYRFSVPGDHYYSTSPNAPRLRGVVPDGHRFSLLGTPAPGTIEVYQCVAGIENWFVSTDPRCEGYRREALLGFAFRTQAPGTVALHRFNQGSDHLVTTEPREGLARRYRSEGILGYVFPAGLLR